MHPASTAYMGVVAVFFASLHVAVGVMKRIDHYEVVIHGCSNSKALVLVWASISWQPVPVRKQVSSGSLLPSS
jgi:hypothetical protein